MTDMEEVRRRVVEGDRHYRVDPGMCVCGFNALANSGLMLDYDAAFAQHFIDFPDREPGEVSPADMVALVEEILRLRQVLDRTQRLTNLALSHGRDH